MSKTSKKACSLRKYASIIFRCNMLYTPAQIKKMPTPWGAYGTPWTPAASKGGGQKLRPFEIFFAFIWHWVIPNPLHINPTLHDGGGFDGGVESTPMMGCCLCT